MTGAGGARRSWARRCVAVHATAAAAAGLLLLAPAVRAQEPVTLDSAIARGLEHSQRLAELQARESAAAAAEAGRAAAALPEITVLGGYTRTNHVEAFGITVPGSPPRIIYPDVPDNYRSRLDVQWPIYTAGRLDALERAARAERQATGEDLAAARADLRLEITRAFWAVVTAGEAVRVVDRALEAIGAHVADLRSRLEQGLIPPNDVLSAEAQEARQRLLAIEAGTTLAVARADLARLLGADDPASMIAVATLESPVAPAAGGPELVAAARSQRPEVRSLADRIEAARARADAARAAALPQVGLAGGYDYARPNPRIFPRAAAWEDSWDVSVNVSWPLWDGGRNRAVRAEATAGVAAAEARSRDFDRQLTFEVRQRMLEVDQARAAIAAAEVGLRAAEEAFRVVGERFQAGVATSTDVLDAETAALQAALDRTRALAGARLAAARLERAVGR